MQTTLVIGSIKNSLKGFWQLPSHDTLAVRTPNNQPVEMPKDPKNDELPAVFLNQDSDNEETPAPPGAGAGAPKEKEAGISARGVARPRLSVEPSLYHMKMVMAKIFEAAAKTGKVKGGRRIELDAADIPHLLKVRTRRRTKFNRL
jgi:hypothetical protein